MLFGSSPRHGIHCLTECTGCFPRWTVSVATRSRDAGSAAGCFDRVRYGGRQFQIDRGVCLTKEIGFLFLLPRCRIDQPHRFRIASVLAIRDHSTKSARVSQKVTSPPAARADGELSVSAQVRHTSTWPRDGSSGCDQLRRQRPEGSNKQSGNGNGTPNSPWYRGPCSSPFEYCSACTSAPSPMTWATPLRHESIFNAPEGYTDPGTATHSRSRAALDPIILVGCPYPSKSCSTGERISPLFWFTSRGTTRDAQRERTS